MRGPLHRFALATILLTAGCGSLDLTRHAPYYRQEPRTILVLPVRNQTTDAEAPRFFLSTIGQPLIERGYYVMPPHLVAEAIAAEGIDLTGESWEIPPERLHRFYGADAVLYIRITEWDTHYMVLASSVTVGLEYRLVHARTGRVLWQHRGRRVVRSGGSRSGSALGDLVANLVSAAVTAMATDYVPLAARLNREILRTLPPGFYHRGHAAFRAGALGEER